MAREFLASDYTDLVFIDDDMGWPEDGLLKLLTYDVDVVGAVCPRRTTPITWNVNLLREAGKRIERDGLSECAYIGTAFLRIRRSAFDLLPGHYFDAKYEGERFIGEDAWFCREIRRNGGRVWADPTIEMTHTGPYVWRGTYGHES